MIEIMISLLTTWKSAPSECPAVVLMSGAGDKSFCAGGDVKAVYKGMVEGTDPLIGARFFYREYQLDHALAQMQPIQVAFWNGFVMGGGVGISMNAPIRIATEKTLYAMPECAIGFFCDAGATYFLPRVHENISYGLYLGVTGHRVRGKENLAWGLATHYASTEDLPKIRERLVEFTQGKDSVSIEEVHKLLGECCECSPGEIPNAKEIEYCFRDDSLELVQERLTAVASGSVEGLDLNFAKKTLSTMGELSPLSMRVVYELVKRGQKWTLEEALGEEYRVC